MTWDPFLMKVLLKKEACGSRKQYGTHLKSKKKKKEDADA